MSRSEYLSRFTPSRTAPDLLEAIFVQREVMARDAEAKIADGATSRNKYHLLYVGPRGSGKTHLVTVLGNRLQQRADLRDRLRIAWLDEDETTTSYLKLLLRINRALHQRYPHEFAAIAPKDIPALDERGRVRVVENGLVERLAGRALLVIVENLDYLLDGLEDAGQKQWRAFLQEKAVANTLATSQQLTHAISSRSAAFHGFFRTVHLEPLNLNEALQLLTNIAEKVTHDLKLVALLGTDVGRNRVHAIDHLTGGSHRLYIMLSEFLTCETLDELVHPFEQLIDTLTPYYQERLRSLPNQQREIVELLARAETTLAVKRIADDLMLSPQAAAAQLKKLAEKGYVRNDRRGRESLYELAEPMMRLCVEVKESGHGPIRLIVEFLRRWFSKEELETRYRALPMEAKTDRLYVGLALKAMGSDVIRESQPDAAASASSPSATLTEAEKLFHEWMAIGEDALKEEMWDLALEAFGNALKLNPEHALAWHKRGFALGELGRWEEALASADRAVEINPEHANAWHNRGWILGNLGRIEEELASYERAVEINPEHASAWFNRGVALGNLGRWEEELASYDRAVEINPEHADAWDNRGLALGNLGRIEEELASYERAVAINPEDADAWHNRGVALGNLGRWDEALASADRAVAINPEHANAWHNRGWILGNLGRWEEALESYDRAVAINPEHANAWHNRGWILGNLGRWEEALESYDRAVAINPEHANAWHNRGGALDNLGRFEEAFASHDRAVAINPEDAFAWHNRGVALHKLRRFAKAKTSFARAGAIVDSAYSPGLDHYRQNQWDEGNAALQVAVEKFPPNEWSERIEIAPFIRAILEATRDGEIWALRAKTLVEIFRVKDGLKLLGEGLVKSLAIVPQAKLDAEALEAWRRAWVEAGVGIEELKLPLRLFDVGMSYHESGDPEELFTLVSTERSLLAEVLGLERKKTR